MDGEIRVRGYLHSAIGLLEVRATAWAVESLTFVDASAPELSQGMRSTSNAVLEAALDQLADYFAGTLRAFDLKLLLRGTSFQQQVWRAVQAVPYGVTISYGALAAAIGSPRAARAVGAANGANAIPIIVPCHRIVGGNGMLTGYGGGLWRKAWLLEHEAAHQGLGSGAGNG